MKKFLKDVVSNYVVYGAQILLSLIAIPVYIGVYGDELYGVYLLSIGLAQSLLFLEFGSGKALLRYVSTYLETKEEGMYGAALRTCVTITVFSSLFVLLLFVLVAYLQELLFDIPEVHSPVSFVLFIGSGVYSMLLIVRQLPLAILRGASVFYQRNAFMVIQVVFRAVLVYLVFQYEIGILCLLIGEIVFILVDVLLDFITLKKYTNGLLRGDLLFATESKRNSRSVFTYAKETFLLSAVGFFSQNSDRLIIGLFLPVEFVTIYTVITKPYQVLKSLLSRVYVVLQPHFVKLYSRNKQKELVGFVARSGELFAYLLLPFLLLGIIVFPSFITYWIGSESYQDYYIYGQLLLGVSGCRVLTTMVYQSIYVNGGTKSLFRIELLTVVVNLLVSIIAVQFIGVGGVIVGTCLQLLLVLPLLLPQGMKFFNLTSARQEFRALYHSYWGLASGYSLAILFSIYYQSLITNSKWVIFSGVLVITIGLTFFYSCVKTKMREAFENVKMVVQDN